MVELPCHSAHSAVAAKEAAIAAFEQRLGPLEDCAILKLTGWSSKHTPLKEPSPATDLAEEHSQTCLTYISPEGECFSDVRQVEAALGARILKGDGPAVVSLIGDARAAAIKDIWKMDPGPNPLSYPRVVDGALRQQRANFELELLKSVTDLKAQWQERHSRSSLGLDVAEQNFDAEQMAMAVASVSTADAQQARQKARSDVISRGRTCLLGMKAMLEERNMPFNDLIQDFEDRIAEELMANQRRHEAAAQLFAKMRQTLFDVCREQRDKFQKTRDAIFQQQDEQATKMQERIVKCIDSLSAQLREERATRSCLLDEEIACLQERTQKFLDANVDPDDSLCKTAWASLRNAEKQKQLLYEGDADFEGLVGLIADVSEKLPSRRNAPEDACHDSSKRRRISLTTPWSWFQRNNLGGA